MRLERIEEDIGALKEGQARLEEGRARLEQKVDTVGGHVSRLTGTDYEAYATKLARRHIYREMGIPGVLTFSTAANNERLHALADEAIEAGALKERQAADMERADLVLTARDQDSNAIYILGEISITTQQDDVRRARERSALLARATGTKTLAVVLAQAAEDNLNTDGVRLIIIPEQPRPADHQ